MRKKTVIILSVSLIFLFIGCKKKSGGTEFQGSNKEVLKNWAENIIIPSYKQYQSKVNQLVVDAQNFDKEKTEENFKKLKISWLEAYKLIQKVLIFDFGYAKNIYFTELSNSYPTNVEEIEKNINLILNKKGDDINFNPTFLSKVYQGFPALDYLLFEDTHTLAYYKTAKGEATSIYMVKLSQELQKNINAVVKHWNENKEDYINDEDKSITGYYAGTINAFIRVYEKQIRAEKVGYAAGAIKAQNGKPAPEIIEAYYNGEVSKEFLRIALQSSQDFFNGKHFLSDKEGKSLKSILSELKHQKLVDDINSQYTKMYSVIDNTPNSLKETAISDNVKMRELYDVIQVNVAHYKTRMLSALSVQVGYQDTDGD